MATNEIGSIYTPSLYGRKSFPLQHKGFPIFYKVFDGSNSGTVNLTSDKIFIENHFFKTGEPLKYDVGTGTSIGISSSSPGVIGVSTYLPSIVYPIVLDKDNIRIALASSLAISNQYANMNALGIGTQHSLETFKQNSKCLLTINNIIQSPISIGSTVQLLSYTSSSITVNNLNNIKLGTILRINGEIVKVASIDYTTKQLKISRGTGVLGTEITPFTSNLIGSNIQVLSGNYNIIKDILYFDDPPLEDKKITFKVLLDDIIFADSSFNFLTSSVKTGDQVLLLWANPPKEILTQGYYYLIKNSTNNYSFASSFFDAINKNKILFSDISTNEFDISDFQIIINLPTSENAFTGRVFLKSNYDGNLIFDDISEQFNGISSSFELKNSGISTVGIKSDNGIVLVNNIFQYPEYTEGFSFSEQNNKTNINFVGFGTTGFLGKSYDINVKGYPRGGIIVSYGNTSGIRYQPLVAAEGIAVISGLGTVQSVTITGKGSGYRSGISTYYVTFEDGDGYGSNALGIANIGLGSVTSVTMLNGGSGYSSGISTYTARFDSPIGYTNLPLTGSISGIGASVSFDIGIYGEVKNLIFTNFGYGYKQDEILTPVGTIGVSTQTNDDKLYITINEVSKDTFSSWNVGILQKLDDLTSQVNGKRKTFVLSETVDNISRRISLDADSQYEIDLQYNLLIFINDILQIPEKSYTFNRGSKITFSESIPYGSTLKIYFYKGYYNDTISSTDLSRIKEGDSLVLNQDIYGSPPIEEKSRTVKEIINSDVLRTEVYNDIGLSESSSQFRSITWTPQKMDLIIDGIYLTKGRFEQRSGITSFSKIATYVGVFTGISTNFIGMSTTNLLLGDYIEGDYVGTGVTIVSIGSSVVGIGTTRYSSSPAGTSSTSLSLYRKL